jgi:hypothetical protein
VSPVSVWERDEARKKGMPKLTIDLGRKAI